MTRKEREGKGKGWKGESEKKNDAGGLCGGDVVGGGRCSYRGDSESKKRRRRRRRRKMIDAFFWADALR